ncbi:MAG: hypothetical protein DWQ37_12900 [Planctomycetota bacterium]|nr:MAG: hypothetical protein DWQ37_12900 [Planctomycetota bacterium]
MRFAALLLASFAAQQALAAGPPVDFEILTDPGLPVTASQEWYQALTKLGVTGLRIRSGGGEPGIDNRGTAEKPSYKVTGVLTADNTLHVPGGKFGPRDSGKLRKWLDKLGDRGAEGVTQRPVAFGLTPSELQRVSEDLMQPVGSSTRGRGALAVAGAIAQRLQIPFVLEDGAKRALADVKVVEEMKELSCGTALAAVLRPAGLVLVPEHPRGGELTYYVGRPRPGREVWPVGWKPEGRAADRLPALFDMLNVEIRETPVADAAVAISGRLEVPILYDYNAMALHGVDPTTTEAEVPAKRMSYSRVLARVLHQAGLEYQLRVDEADKPFLWITTLKPAP